MYTLVESRIISGVGIIRIADMGTIRDAYIVAQVIRRPLNERLNFSHTPPKGFYANICVMQDDTVIESLPMNFPIQLFRINVDSTYQNLIAIKCAYEGTLQSIANLASSLGLPVINIVDLIENYRRLPIMSNQYVFNCFADTAIQLSLFKLDVDSCSAQKTPNPVELPEPPILPEVPPGTGIGSLSPPYEDDDFTSPNPLDAVNIPGQIDPPIGDVCVPVEVVFRGVPLPGEPTPGTATVRVYAPVAGFSAEPSAGGQDLGVDLLCNCRGTIFIGAACREQANYVLVNNVGNASIGQSFEIVSVDGQPSGIVVGV